MAISAYIEFTAEVPQVGIASPNPLDITANTTPGVTSFNGRSGVVAPSSGDYNSGQVSNTSTVTGATVTGALETLDTNKNDKPAEGAFVDGDKTKLDGIETGAEVNNISDINATDLTDSGETTLHTHPAATPASHALSHTDGTDDIQDATASQKGLATAAQITKLDGIETSADVTDTTNVDAAGATMNADTSLAGNGYFLDEDDMSSDDATKVASQQSIKKFVEDSILRTNDLNQRTVTSASVTVLDTDELILADCSSNAISCALPTPGVNYNGFTCTIKLIDATNAITITSASGNIDGTLGTTGVTISAVNASLTLTCDGTNWWIV